MTQEKNPSDSTQQPQPQPLPAPNTAHSSNTSLTTSLKPPPPPTKWRRFLDVVNWKPPRTRWDPANPPVFNMPMNVLFGFAGAFTVANLYYSHPILNILADDFAVEYEKVSQIPTLAQAGYATGLLFLCPLGDLFKRRPFVLLLVFFTATMWLGLCLTNNFAAFSAISYITGITTVTPQLMLPLVGDLAPAHRRATALSIVGSGNLLGILIARLLSGVVTNFTSWRNIYWIALALQYSIFFLLWLFMPDYPSTNPHGLNYFKMLWSILLMLRKHPVLVQACLVAFATSAPFTSFWTTLTFLLAGDPYNYTPLVIGLFALIGIAGMCLTPLYARLVIDRHVPLFSVLVGEAINITGILIGTYGGLYSVAAPAIQAFFIDMGLQTTAIANRSAIYAVEPHGRNRINTAYMVFTFLGQITGTAAGNTLFAKGGWLASGSLSVGFCVFAFAVCLVRGPWEEGWVGWKGGWSIKKRERGSADGRTREAVLHGGVRMGEKEGIEGGRSGVDVEKTPAATEPTSLTNTQKATQELAAEDGENPVRRANDAA